MSNESLYDLSAFREMDAEDPGALDRIVTVFLESTPDVIGELNQHYRNANMPGVAQLAHKLKATIDILSIYPLQAVIRQVEQIGKSGVASTELPALMDILNLTLEEVFKKIQEEIN